MRIDFDRLILLLLPIRLRTVRLFSLLQVFLSPIATLYNQLMIDINLKRYRVACTPQTVWLEKIIKIETGVTVGIQTADGKPNDFVVTYPSTTPERVSLAIQSIIDRYKLAGRSYAMIGGVATNISTWGGYVVELIEDATVIDSTAWGDYVNELINVGQVPCYLYAAFNQYEGEVTLFSEVPVASDVSVRILFRWKHHGNNASKTVDLIIRDAELISDPITLDFVVDAGTLTGEIISGPTPASDNDYIYSVHFNF